MKSKIMYVELKSGHADNGPAWIGKAHFSKSGRTVYFNGRGFKIANVIGGNAYDIETGEEYWISGIKKDGSDRHWAGSGKVMIDKEVVEEYLELISLKELSKKYYEIVELDNNPPKEKINKLKNEKL